MITWKLIAFIQGVEVNNDYAEIKKRIKENPFKTGWWHTWKVLGGSQKDAKEFYTSYIKKKGGRR